MKLKRIINAILRKMGIWSVRYHIMHTKISINLINQKIDLLLKDFPYEIIQLSYEDFLKGDPSFYTKKKLKKYENWYQNGGRSAYGIIKDNSLIYSAWINLDKIEITNKTSIRGYDNVGLLQDAYCDKKYRGRGLHNFFNLFRVKKIYEKGRGNAIGIVRIDNTPSVKALKNATFVEVETIKLKSFFGKESLTKLPNDY